jgi:hypothetical protein
VAQRVREGAEDQHWFLEALQRLAQVRVGPPILPYLALSCPILPYPTLSCRILPYHILSCPTCPILPSLTSLGRPRRARSRRRKWSPRSRPSCSRRRPAPVLKRAAPLSAAAVSRPKGWGGGAHSDRGVRGRAWAGARPVRTGGEAGAGAAHGDHVPQVHDARRASTGCCLSPLGSAEDLHALSTRGVQSGSAPCFRPSCRALHCARHRSHRTQALSPPHVSDASLARQHLHQRVQRLLAGRDAVLAGLARLSGSSLQPPFSFEPLYTHDLSPTPLLL